MDHAPLRGDAQLAAFGGSGVQLALLEHLEQAGGVEVGDLDGLSRCIGFEHVSMIASTTDSQAPESARSGGSGDKRR
ncbi:hypothetical protein GCM10027601_24620 [Nocardioides ungokensis]